MSDQQVRFTVITGIAYEPIAVLDTIHNAVVCRSERAEDAEMICQALNEKYQLPNVVLDLTGDCCE